MKIGCSVTRTYDDIVVSTDSLLNIDSVNRIVRDELATMGLGYSRRKADKSGLQVRNASASRPVFVHKIDVQSRAGTAIAKHQSDKTLKIAKRYRDGCRCVSADTIEALALLRQQVVGHMRHVGQATFGPYRNVKQMLDAGDRAVERRLNFAGIEIGKAPWHAIRGSVNEPRRLAAPWRAVASSSR